MGTARRVGTTNSWREGSLVRLFVAILIVLFIVPTASSQEKGSPDVEQLRKRIEGLQQEGRLADAILLAQEMVEVIKRSAGEENPTYAFGLNLLAGLYMDQGQYALAEPFYQRSLAIYEKTLGSDHPYLAVVLINLARLYGRQGRYAEAGTLCRRGLAIDEKALGPEHPDLAPDWQIFGELCRLQGRYPEAESSLERALAIREKASGPDHPDVAAILYSLALLYKDEGRTVDAAAIQSRVLAIREKAFGPDHPDVAASLNGLAELLRGQAKYAEAEPLYKRSLAIREKALGPDHPDVAITLNNLALLYSEQGKFAEAEELFKRCLEIQSKVLGPDHPDLAASLSNLAALYRDQGRYAAAALICERALAIDEKSLGPEHPYLAITLNNLAGLYRAQGRYAEAEPIYKRSLAIREKALGPRHPDVANSLNNLALLYFALGRYAEAEPLYKRGLAIFEEFLGPSHPNMAISLINYAALQFAQGRYAEAQTFFERCLQNLHGQFEYGFTYMSEKDRLQYLSTVSYCFAVYFSFCLSYRDELPALAGKLYDVLLWEKGFVAQSVAALRAKIQAGGDPEALRLLTDLSEKKSELAKLAAAPPESDPQKQAARRARIEELGREANDLEQALVSRSSILGEDKRLARVSWQQVRDALGPDEAAVEIVRFPFYDGKKWTDTRYYIALVLRPDSRGPDLVVLGEQKDLERIPLADYRRLAGPPGTDRPKGAGRRFYEAFWLPLEAKLGRANRIFVSPDGELNQVSLGITPGGDGRLLMETYDLRTVNSTKDLLRGTTVPAVGAAVLVGNPRFELSEADERAVLGSSIPERASIATGRTVSRVSNLRSGDLRGGALEELPGTQKEVEDVSGIFKRSGRPFRTYTGKEALEERVKEVSRPRVLHLATHGFFEADEPRKSEDRGGGAAEDRAPLLEDPMLRSGVYLAGANRVLKGGPGATDLEDGILTAYEASQLNLQGTELVVLSACETGLGKTEAGEGVFGLRRGLQVAGAEAVLMSLWAVPDEETRELMALFYGKWLAGKSKHAALREAQLEMRENVKARTGEDRPFFWGAFVLVGR
jgi:tetratricopeptide (TPR) repeat protein